jgi:hypothetical protein
VRVEGSAIWIRVPDLPERFHIPVHAAPVQDALVQAVTETSDSHPRKSQPALSIVGLVAAVLFCCFWGVLWHNQVDRSIAADNIKQYEIAVRNGNHVDASVQAGIIAYAYLDAKDEANYRKWKAIQEREDNAGRAESEQEVRQHLSTPMPVYPYQSPSPLPSPNLGL